MHPPKYATIEIGFKVEQCVGLAWGREAQTDDDS